MTHSTGLDLIVAAGFLSVALFLFLIVWKLGEIDETLQTFSCEEAGR